MAKTDRGVLINNDQEYGMIADPNKLESSITHAYDIIDQNDDELIAHKSSGDHDGRYFTKTQLDGGQLDNRYYTETEIDIKVNNLQSQITTNTNDISAHKTSDDHDTRYYTKTEMSSGGAAKIGITQIVGLSASNTQQALEVLNNKINQTALGQIPDGSITLQKLSFSPILSSEKGAPNGVATLGPDGKVPAAQLNVSTTANAISITDSGGYYTGTDVETALQEIGQTMNAMRGSLITSVNNILNM